MYNVGTKNCSVQFYCGLKIFCFVSLCIKRLDQPGFQVHNGIKHNNGKILKGELHLKIWWIEKKRENVKNSLKTPEIYAFSQKFITYLRRFNREASFFLYYWRFQVSNLAGWKKNISTLHLKICSFKKYILYAYFSLKLA